MKKKLITLLLTLSMAFATFGFSGCEFPLSSSPDSLSGSQNDDLSSDRDDSSSEDNEPILGEAIYRLVDTYYMVTGITPTNAEKITILDRYNNLPVTRIGHTAFKSSKNLTSIEIPSSVTSIAQGAFEGCSSLTSVYFGGTSERWSLTSIGLFNYNLTNATLYYYSETKPTATGNYWHYVDGVATVWD